MKDSDIIEKIKKDALSIMKNSLEAVNPAEAVKKSIKIDERSLFSKVFCF